MNKIHKVLFYLYLKFTKRRTLDAHMRAKHE